jgi:hypothetical protein
MTMEDTQTLLEVARWIATHRNIRSTIRRIAKTEENYLLFVQELDRVESQCFRARTMHAEATLTLVEWLEALNYFHWHCAYCQLKPFQVMSHYLPLAQGGTTAMNCVPACYHCRQNREKENEHIRDYFAHVQACKNVQRPVPPIDPAETCPRHLPEHIR